MGSAPDRPADAPTEESDSGMFIELESTLVHGDAALFRISYGESLTRYLDTGLFYLRYDFPLERVPQPILSIPLLGCLAPLGWLTGAEIRVGDVEAEYLNSLPQVLQELRKMFPEIAFSGRIRAHPVKIDSEWDPEKYCLLYSGGVDSTFSLVRNFEKRPSLLRVRGTPDLRLFEGQYWTRVQERVQPFVDSLGVEAHVVETNAIDMVDLDALKTDYVGKLVHGWWEELAHGLFFLSISAPYTFFNKIGRLIIASSHTERSKKPWGSSPQTDERVSWGGVRVIHDSYDLHKVEKIQALIPWMKNRGSPIPLRVCTGERGIRLASGQLNCGQCGKCMRTELILIIFGADASENGFDISPSALRALRHNLETGRIDLSAGLTSWKFIKTNIRSAPEEIVAKRPGLRDFLDWLADWDEQSTRKRRRYVNVAPLGSRRRSIVKAILGKKERLGEGTNHA